MILPRPLVALALALVLMASSVTVAVGRDQTGIAGWMELCAGGQSMTVAVDAEGRPVAPPHPCPDCLTGQPGALPSATSGAGTAPAGFATLRPLYGASAAALRTTLHAQARAPPLAV